MTRPRHLAPGQLPDGSWECPKDLRCVDGPFAGNWCSHPPMGYTRLEVRGGAVWAWIDNIWPPHAMPGAER